MCSEHTVTSKCVLGKGFGYYHIIWDRNTILHYKNHRRTFMALPGVNVPARVLQWAFPVCTSKEKLINFYLNCSDNNLPSCVVCCLWLVPQSKGSFSWWVFGTTLKLVPVRVAFRQLLACCVLASAYLLAAHQNVIFKSVLCSSGAASVKSGFL